jgi:hypothetical protein
MSGVDVFARLGREPPDPRDWRDGERDSERGRFVPASELRASLPPDPEGVLGSYLVERNLTLLGGKPKVGKSTLALAVAEAIGSHAQSFLGQPVNGGPVLYVSEESGSTLIHKLPAGDVRFLTRDLAWPPPSWKELIEITAAEVRAVGAVAVVIDTLAHWAGFAPEKEKDAGAMQAALRHAQALAQAGPAVLLTVHVRKGGGEDGEALRGSSALAGAADIILELERVDDSPRERALLALWRYPSTPGVLLIDHNLVNGSWSVAGESSERADKRKMADRQALLRACDEALTRTELESALGSPALQWKGTLDTLVNEGLIEQTGEGVRGDPYRWKKVCTDSVQTPAQKCTESGPAAASVSGVCRKTHQKQAGGPASADSVRCTETDSTPSDGWTDDELSGWSTPMRSRTDERHHPLGRRPARALSCAHRRGAATGRCASHAAGTRRRRHRRPRARLEPGHGLRPRRRTWRRPGRRRRQGTAALRSRRRPRSAPPIDATAACCDADATPAQGTAAKARPGGTAAERHDSVTPTCYNRTEVRIPAAA